MITQLQHLLQDRITVATDAINSTRSSFASDTKSSAGDKHEVGRAMVQQELDKLEEQRAKTQALIAELARVPLDRTFDRAGFGSLVTTDHGIHFIAIGLGRVALEDQEIFAISLGSPIGEALHGKRVGDTIEFNGNRITILSIA